MANVAPDTSDYLAYEVNKCVIYFKDREQEIQSGEIHSFSIGCNYDGTEFFPEFSISMTLDRKTFFDIMKEKDNLTMLLRVDYYIVVPLGPDHEEKGRKRTWFNERFVVFMDDNHFDMMLDQNKAMIEEYGHMGDPKKDIAQHKEYNLEFFIYKERDINTAYYVSNKVYTDTDKTSLVAHLLSRSGAKNVLMSPLANNGLKEAMTLPITTIANLKYLDAQYGLHSHGTIIFFDLDFTYILNKKIGAATAWRKGEITKVSFIVRKDTDELSFMGGSKQDDEKKIGFINISPENISYKSYSSMDNLIYGGQVKLIDTYKPGTQNVTTAGRVRKPQLKYVHNKYRNDQMSHHMQQKLNDRGIVPTINISDANIYWFRPNKNFTITYANPELHKLVGGSYKILNIFMNFTNFGSYFRNESTMQFSKALRN